MKFTLIKGEDDKKFEFIYNGFIIGGSLVQQKGLQILRRELTLLDKLESISKDCECGKKIINEEHQRELEGGTIELDMMELKLLTDYIGSVPWSSGKSVRDALATLDYLHSLPSSQVQ
jgi:hypothetical protein